MSTVSHLPDSYHRQWRVYEGLLRDHFAAAGAASIEIDHAASAIKPIYLESARMTFSSTANGDELVNEMNDWVQCQVFALTLQIALREIELFRLRG